MHHKILIHQLLREFLSIPPNITTTKVPTFQAICLKFYCLVKCKCTNLLQFLYALVDTFIEQEVSTPPSLLASILCSLYRNNIIQVTINTIDIPSHHMIIYFSCVFSSKALSLQFLIMHISNQKLQLKCLSYKQLTSSLSILHSITSLSSNLYHLLKLLGGLSSKNNHFIQSC